MAKAKSKAKSNTRKTASKTAKGRKMDLKNAPQMPNGYKTIGRAPNWNPEKNPVLQGERGKTREVVLDEGTKNEREVRTFILEDEEIGPVTVWESAMLADLFENTDDGDSIRIEFLGYGKAKRGQNAPKLFSCGVKA